MIKGLGVAEGIIAQTIVLDMVGLIDDVSALFRFCPNPHFSPGIYCGDVMHGVCCVMLARPPRHTVQYACVGRAAHALEPPHLTPRRGDAW